MYPNSIYIGLKVVPIWLLGGQGTYYLGTWTHGVSALESACWVFLLSVPLCWVRVGFCFQGPPGKLFVLLRRVAAKFGYPKT